MTFMDIPMVDFPPASPKSHQFTYASLRDMCSSDDDSSSDYISTSSNDTMYGDNYSAVREAAYIPPSSFTPIDIKEEYKGSIQSLTGDIFMESIELPDNSDLDTIRNCIENDNANDNANDTEDNKLKDTSVTKSSKYNTMLNLSTSFPNLPKANQTNQSTKNKYRNFKIVLTQDPKFQERNKIINPMPTVEYDEDEYYVYKDIMIGEGKCYTIKKGDIDYNIFGKMKEKCFRKLIQVFIEIRNALGYESIEPHFLTSSELLKGVVMLCEEYHKEYGFQFNYTYDKFRKKNSEPCNFPLLHMQRLKNIGCPSIHPDGNFVPLKQKPFDDLGRFTPDLKKLYPILSKQDEITQRDLYKNTINDCIEFLGPTDYNIVLEEQVLFSNANVSESFISSYCA